MQRRYEKIYSPAVGREMQLLAFGHYGPPVIAFPSGGGQFYDFENNGMVDEIMDAGWKEHYSNRKRTTWIGGRRVSDKTRQERNCSGYG